MSEPNRSIGDTSALLRVLLDACPDAVVLVDAGGTIVHVNRQVRTLLGYQPSELLGRPLEVLVPETSRERHVRYRTLYEDRPAPRAMADGVDLHARHQDGRQVPVDIALAPLAELAGQPVTAAFVRDATERRRAEEHRRERLEADMARGHALEINDAVIQGLAVILYALELGDVEAATRAVARTAKTAQQLVEQLLGADDEGAVGGRLVRSRAALPEVPAEDGR
ncbi:MAG TPA: PAS domain S-box protein [Nitriliruptorales bacterium]|nr:PAS domain S-box protein [Nitriliruptorales bacterium]